MTGSSRPSLGLVALAALGAWACTPEAPSGLASRNLIVMIADGAGVEHWTLAHFARNELAVRWTTRWWYSSGRPVTMHAGSSA